MAYSADQLPSGLDAKTTPVDADVVPIGDSADSNRARKVTWANIKATLKTYFDTLYTIDLLLPTQTGNNGKFLTTNGSASSWGTVSAGAAALNDLTDVTISAPVNNQLLKYNGSAWVNATVSGTGDVVKVGTPVDNQVGVWTGDGTVEGTAGLTFSANVLGVGTGATGTVQSNGNQDLILKTGNATSGSITIADGASGAINISPDANGHVYIDINGPTGKLQVGNGSGNGYITSQGAQDLVLATNGGTNSGLITITGGANGNISIAPNGTGAVVFSSTVEMGGNVSLGENASIDLDPALSADGKYSGTCITGTAGATLAFGDVVYLAAADSRWELTDADAVGTAGTVLVGICVLAAAADGNATKILLHGNIRADAKFPTLTISAPVYIDTTTAGAVTQTAPTGADDVVRVLGFALTADSMYFNPSPDHITHLGA